MRMQNGTTVNIKQYKNLTKLKLEVTYGLVLFLSIYLKELKSEYQRDIITSKFTAALTIARIRKIPWAREWIKFTDR